MSGFFNKNSVAALFAMAGILAIGRYAFGVHSSSSIVSQVSHSHASTRPPFVTLHPLPLSRGSVAPDFSAEMLPGTSLADGMHGGEWDRGTLMFFARFVPRLTLIEVVDSGSLNAITIGATAAVERASKLYQPRSFSSTLRLDAFAFDVSPSGVERWTSTGAAPGIRELENATAATDIQWGIESDVGLSKLPYALRDVYAAHIFPTVVLVDKHMSVIYVARGRAAADWSALSRVVGQSVISQDQEARS
jgi:hypothetical protein